MSVHSYQSEGGKVPVPLFSGVRFDIPAGSQVLIKVMHNQCYTGTVLINPDATGHKHMIELVNITDMLTKKLISDSMYFLAWEVIELTVLKEPDPGLRKAKEVRLPTDLVNDAVKLGVLIQSLSDVKQVGVQLFGSGLGRFAHISWIMISTGSKIIPIDASILESCSVWEKLRQPLFENKRLTKIFHNMRPAVDYLFHKHAIRPENVYDTQLTDFLISRKEGQALGQLMTKRTTMMQLSSILLKYMPNEIPEKEIRILESSTSDKVIEPATPEDPRPLLKGCRDVWESRKYMTLSVKYMIELKERIEEVRNSRFNELAKCYADDMINTPLGEAQLNLACTSKPPRSLESMIRTVFSATQADERNGSHESVENKT